MSTVDCNRIGFPMRFSKKTFVIHATPERVACYEWSCVAAVPDGKFMRLQSYEREKIKCR